MSHRIQKFKSSDCTKKREKIDKSVALISSTLSQPTEIELCFYCEKKRTQCLASEKDSNRCSEYVKDYKFYCKAFTAQQSLHISRRRDQLDSEVKAAEEEVMLLIARVNHLREQRKDWIEKTARVVSRDINNLEELESVEQEQEESGCNEAARQATLLVPGSTTNNASNSKDAANWFAFILDPLLFPSIESSSMLTESPRRF